MRPSRNLAKFQVNFVDASRKAFVNRDGVLTIGLGHTNQDIEPFTTVSEWEPEKILEVWERDLADALRLANLWLQRKIEQHQFDAIVDLLTDEVFMHDYRPYSLIALLKANNTEAAADQFLRWIVDKNMNVTISRMCRAFARRALFLNKDYEPYVKALGSVQLLNKIIEPEGYKAISDPKYGFRLIRCVYE